MPINVYSKYEEELQKSQTHTFLHLPEKDRKEIYSFHQRGKHKSLWYLSNWEAMESKNSPTNIELVTYRSKTYPYHSLHRSLLTTKTPEIRIAEGYQARFCYDLFINMIKEYQLVLNDTVLQIGNTKSLFFELKSQENWAVNSEELGNRPELTTWSRHIPASEIALYLPWFYAKDKSDAFPLRYCGQNDNLNHHVEYNLDLSSLLLLRDSEGNPVEYSPEIVTVASNSETLPVPEMEGLYSFLNEKESDINDSKSDETDGQKEIFVDSLYYIEDENEMPLNKKINLKIPTKFKQPIHSVYWGALNTTLCDEKKTSCLHYYQNDRMFSPVKYSRLENNIGVVMDNKSSYKTEKAYHVPLTKTVIPTPGLNFWYNSVGIREDGRKFVPGVRFNGGSLTVMLKEKNSEDKFKTFAILNYTKRFRFTTYPSTHQERLTRGCTIEPDEDH